MGLCLFPGDNEIDGPDACFSYHEFALFRRHLASEEGFSLEEMDGFNGDRPWSDVQTVLEPLLNHPDSHGRNITFEECTLILPRLEEILCDWTINPHSNPVPKNQIREISDLVTVLRVCISKKVEMCFM